MRTTLLTEHLFSIAMICCDHQNITGLFTGFEDFTNCFIWKTNRRYMYGSQSNYQNSKLRFNKYSSEASSALHPTMSPTSVYNIHVHVHHVQENSFKSPTRWLTVHNTININVNVFTVGLWVERYWLRVLARVIVFLGKKLLSKCLSPSCRGWGGKGSQVNLLLEGDTVWWTSISSMWGEYSLHVVPSSYWLWDWLHW